MAERGRKPTATVIKLATGNPGKRALPKQEPDPGGKPVPPKWLAGRGAELWDEVTGFAFWLTRADGFKLGAWCDREADFETDRKHWTAADRREHRSAGSELGLDPGSRARLGKGVNGGEQKETVAAKFFDRERGVRPSR